MSDPRVTETFWQTWKDFEIKHGNEDTLREMLRIKRSVQALYNTQVDFMASQMLAQKGGAAVTTAAGGNAMAALEEKMMAQSQNQLAATGGADVASNIKFVRGGTFVEKQAQGENKEPGEKILAKNPAEIDIDFEDNDEDEEDNGDDQKQQPKKSSSESTAKTNLEKQPVPLEVFGGLVGEDDKN